MTVKKLPMLSVNGTCVGCTLVQSCRCRQREAGSGVRDSSALSPPFQLLSAVPGESYSVGAGRVRLTGIVSVAAGFADSTQMNPHSPETLYHRGGSGSTLNGTDREKSCPAGFFPAEEDKFTDRIVLESEIRLVSTSHGHVQLSALLAIGHI